MATSLIHNHRDETRHDATAPIASPDDPRNGGGKDSHEETPFDEPRSRADEPRCGAYGASEGEIRSEEGDEGRNDLLRIPVGWA